MTRKLLMLISLLVVVSMVLAACGRGGGDETPAEEPAVEAPAVEEPAAEEPTAEAPAEAPTEAAPAEEAPAEEAAASEAMTETAEAEATDATTETEEAAASEATTETEEAGEAAAVSDGSDTPAVEGGFFERALAGEFDGTVVTMSGPFVDADQAKFEDSVAAFEEATGIDIQYEGTKEFETIISTRVDGGDAPDIADFPQPGLLANFVRDGKVIDVSTFLPEEYLQQQYLQSWIDMSVMEGPDGPINAGIWTRFNSKSLVWYPKVAWEEAGYEIPATWEEMQTLMDTIVSDGDAPWCIGIESGAATGWAATDWMEEFMLRTTTLENYDAWVKGDLAFSSPEVMAAGEQLASVWLNEDYVLGGTEGIVSTSFGNSPAPMFEDPPRCWMHKQGTFITSFFPAGLEAGVDYGVFYFPGVDEEFGKPALVAGDIYAMFNDRDEVKAVMEFFTRGESLKAWLEQGGTLATQLDVQLDWYGSALERDLAALAAEATAVRFDASDLMPGEVGAGSFWTGMTNWIAGTTDMETAFEEIDASWPR
ncbi:MAG: ABC transporter substrate-binding protein [Caldilineaceae bacterium]